MSWAVAFTLGAIVSPTDALAATEIMSRVGAPRRIVSIVEGESLVNDGTALVLYKAAIGAAVGGTFSLLDTSGRIVLNVVGGIAVGLAVGWVDSQGAPAARRSTGRGRDRRPQRLPRVPARHGDRRLGRARGGDVGVYMGWYTPELTNERTRLVGNSFWNIFVFLANALFFTLVGLQLRRIVDALYGLSYRRGSLVTRRSCAAR